MTGPYPPPPAGFTIDGDEGFPPPPAGFTIDAAGQRPSPGGPDVQASPGMFEGIVPPGPASSLTPADRFAKGARDPLDASAQMLVHGPDWLTGNVNRVAQAADDLPYVGSFFKGIGFTPSTPEQMDKGIAERERSYQAAREQGAPIDPKTGKPDPGFDWWRGFGNMAGIAPLALAAPAATGYGGALMLGAATGAAANVLQPTTTPTDQFWPDKGRDAARGAGAGALLGPLGTLASRVIAPPVSDAVRLLSNRGITLTPGQILGGGLKKFEEKLTSVPLAGDAISAAQRRSVEQFNRATYNDALEPLGQRTTAAVGREGIADVESRIGAHYDALLPQVTFRADPQFQLQIAALRAQAQRLPADQARRFEGIIEDQITGKLTNGRMTGETMKGAESEMTRLARGFRSDASFDQRELGGLVFDTVATLRDALARANPAQADALRAANAAWARFTRIRDAGGRIGSKEGVFTPDAFQSAVRAGDKSVAKGQFARGDALMQDLSEAGKTVIGDRYPDSGTPGRTLAAVIGSVIAGHPWVPVALGAGALAYTRPAVWAASKLLSSRPDIAYPAAQLFRQLMPAVQQGAASLRADRPSGAGAVPQEGTRAAQDWLRDAIANQKPAAPPQPWDAQGGPVQAPATPFINIGRPNFLNALNLR